MGFPLNISMVSAQAGRAQHGARALHASSHERARMTDQSTRLAALEAETNARLEKMKAASKASAPAEPQELSASSQLAIQRQQELKNSIEMRKRARELAVPTNDNAVKLKLREFNEPICIFGEAAPERRERLRDVMAANLDLDAPFEAARGAETALQRAKRPATHEAMAQAAADAQEEDKRKESFFTEGSEELKTARRWIAGDSLSRAARRLEAERARVEREAADVTAHETAHTELSRRVKGVQNQLSNFADERPISFVAFAPGSQMVATGSWSALVKLWSVPDCKLVATLKGHTERISGLAWHPHAGGGALSPSAVNLVSAACDVSPPPPPRVAPPRLTTEA